MRMNPHILICDDHKSTHEALAIYLCAEDMTFESAFDGEEALQMINTKQYDLIILDLMMPKISGIEVCREIRKKSEVPIIMLTAKGDEVDRIIGLEMGADDYVIKPFSPREIVVRIRNILKRTKVPQHVNEQRICLPDLVVDLDRYEVSICGEVIKLTPKEIEILYLLARDEGKVFAREQILNKVWGYDYLGDTRTVDTQIKRLRQKLPTTESFEIKSIYGVGYKLEVIK